MNVVNMKGQIVSTPSNKNPRIKTGQMVKLKNGLQGMVVGQSYATRQDFLCRLDVRIEGQTRTVREDELL